MEAVKLPGRPRVEVTEQDVFVDLKGQGGVVKLWALPLRYPDILTVVGRL